MLKVPASQDKLTVINNVVEQSTLANINLEPDMVSCSDKLCGILVSAMDMKDIESALDDITSDTEIRNTLRGGSMPIFEENGHYYGLLLGAIGNKAINIQ